MSVDVNMVAVFLAAVSSMVVGAVWYSKSVFGTTWIKLAKLDEKKMAANAPKALSIAFLSSLVMAYILAHVTFLSHHYFNNSFLQDALTTAFYMWLGFIALRFLMHDTFEGRRKKLTLLSIGNELVTILVMGLIIGILK